VNVVTNGDGVFPINLTTNTAGPKILTGDMGSVGTVFSGTAINPSGTMMVTCNTIQHTLSFIDLTTNTVTATVGVANQPVKAAFSPDGSKLFVTSYSSNTFTVLDASTNPPAPLGALNVGNFPTEIRVNSTGTRVYVQAQQAGSPFWPLIAEVDVTNPSSPVLMNQRTFAASNPTWAILGWRLSADNGKLYVARGNTAYTIGGGGVSIAEGGGLTVLSTADGTIIDETLTGRMPWSLGISGDESVMVTADINQDGITVHGEPTQGCYGNCDGSTTAPVLNVADFTCFLQRYAAGESYANCDGSTTAPVLNVADFTCFLQQYAAGCR
jgi:YVTN family beta-propeller protein